MRIWFKMWKDTHLIQTDTIDDYSDDTRTHKIFAALEEIEFDYLEMHVIEED